MNTKNLKKILTDRLIYTDITGLILQDGDFVLNYFDYKPSFAVIEYGFCNKFLMQIENEIKFPCIIFHTYDVPANEYKDDDLILAYNNTKFVSCIFTDAQYCYLKNNIEDNKCYLKAVKFNLDMLKERFNETIVNEFINIKNKVLNPNNKHRYNVIKQTDNVTNT